MKLSRVCIGLAATALILLIVSGPLTRFGLVHFRTGLLIFAAALIFAIGAFTLAVVSLIVPRLRGNSAGAFKTAVALSTIVMVPPAIFVQKARGVPAIHDITTDTDNPPAFVDVMALRQTAGAANPPEYPGASVAAEQKRAYADLAPLDLGLPPAEAFPRALAAARAMGWEIVAERPTEGRIEATATTAWFGFKDDIVIRLAPGGSGTRVDVRSKSRVGRSDVGANAARIRDYLAKLRS
mgnify:CR=1 FL=1